MKNATFTPGRGRPRGARFPHTISIAFSESQMSTLETLAERANVSVASLVRDAVGHSMPRLRAKARRLAQARKE